jgi:hypothetical protein
MSRFHATVLKELPGLWVYRVYDYWDTPRQALVIRGSFPSWIEAFTQAAGTVSAFRTAYEYKGPIS